MSMPKYLMLTWAAAEDEDEFMNYIKHLKEEHQIKITIQEDKTNILYFGEDPAGNKELYGIKKKKEKINVYRNKNNRKRIHKIM